MAKTAVSTAEPAPQGVFHMPLEKAHVLSHYGKRGRSFHAGIDLRRNKSIGDPVLASREGRVVFAGNQSGYGRMIKIQHADGYSTLYAHLHRVQVKVNQRVRAGEVIGTVGKTGRATTPHLHFEIRTPKNRPVDPRGYLFR